MSTGRRAYDLLRGFVNTEWERIRGVEAETDAQRELNEAMDLPNRPRATSAPVTEEALSQDRIERARSILGVAPNATFSDIRKAFERLNKRSDPGNFPEGSTESRQAADIQTQINRAYNVLTEGMDDTEKRFRSLEID